LNIETAISTRLSEFTALTALLNDSGIWAVLAPESQKEPYIVWSIFDETPTEVMGGSTMPTIASLQISVYTSTFDEIIPITAQIKACLARFTGTVAGVVIQTIFFEALTDLFDREDNNYHRAHTFRVFYEE